MEHKLVRGRKRKARGTRNVRSAAHKLRSVRRVLGGLSAVKVAALYGDSPRAVSNWVARFKARGAAGLETAMRSGRPSALSPSQLSQVERHVRECRKRSERVSGPRLSAFIASKFGVSLTRQHCLRIIKRVSA